MNMVMPATKEGRPMVGIRDVLWGIILIVLAVLVVLGFVSLFNVTLS